MPLSGGNFSHPAPQNRPLPRRRDRTNPKKTTGQKAVLEYSKQQEPIKKAELGQLEDYLPLVKFIAGRLAIGLPRSVEAGDLINAGVVGLIEAYRNFDTSKGVKFDTYASLRVRGSILDELRSMDWVPRSVRARSHEVEKVLARIENELGRQPSEEELAGALGAEMAEYYEIIGDVRSTALLSLDEMAYEEGDDKAVPLIDTIRSPEPVNALG